MPLEFELAYSNSLVQVQTSGSFDTVSAFNMWQQIIALCTAKNCNNILGISKLCEPMPRLDALEHVQLLRSAGVRPEHRIAWVAGRESLRESLRLAETVFEQRSPLAVKIFDSVAEAHAWLNAVDSGDDPGTGIRKWTTPTNTQ